MTFHPKSSSSLALATLLGLAVPALAVAFPGHGGGGGGGDGHPGKHHGPPPIHRMLDHHAERLGLDDATQARIREIADQARESAREKHEAVRALHREMRELLEASSPDEAAVMRQADRLGTAQTALHKHRLATLLEIRALLTPEQRAELGRIHEERMTERRERRERRRDRKGGEHESRSDTAD